MIETFMDWYQNNVQGEIDKIKEAVNDFLEGSEDDPTRFYEKVMTAIEHIEEMFEVD